MLHRYMLKGYQQYKIANYVVIQKLVDILNKCLYLLFTVHCGKLYCRFRWM